MSYENPTPLRVGMAGSLEGWRGRIAGRVVLGIDYEGERYYWNEFNLVDGFGRSSTLVFEDGDEGPQWKLFKPFDPVQPLAAGDAASKRIGDTVSLDGISRRVTLVEESRVYYVEGTAPEGVEVGDVAGYFNVDEGERMLVTSWTGDEVEFFEGKQVSVHQVRRGFGLAPATRPGDCDRPQSDTAVISKGNSVPIRPLLTVAVLVAVAAVTAYSCERANRGRPAVPRSIPSTEPVRDAQPALELQKGAAGTLEGRNYVVQKHVRAEISVIGARQLRREYQLSTENGDAALLVNGLNGGTDEWHLLKPVPAPVHLTPFEAANVKSGANFGVPGMIVTALFRAEARDAKGTTSVYYGFLCRNDTESLMVRWTETQLDMFEGVSVDEAEVVRAFGPRIER